MKCKQGSLERLDRLPSLLLTYALDAAEFCCEIVKLCKNVIFWGDLANLCCQIDF